MLCEMEGKNMKWFQRKQTVKKKDEHSTYLKVENGRVVPVTGEEKSEKELEKERAKEPLHRVYDESEEEEPVTKGAKWLKWLWLLVILGLGYATIQVFGGLASENQETFKLQEIQRNTLEIPVSDEKTPEKTEPAKDAVTLEERTTSWKEDMKDAFTSDEPSDKKTETSEQPPAPDADRINADDNNLLFAIRSLDEQGTELLEEIREASVKHIQGDMSRGQYLLRLQSVDLKVKRYSQQIADMTEQASVKPSYSPLLDYVIVKKESLQSLSVELRVASTGSVAPVFNGYVDVHNDLTKEADDEFVRQLKAIGYDAKIQNGVISYR